MPKKKADPARRQPAPPESPEERPVNLHAELLCVLERWADATMGDDWDRVVVTIVPKGRVGHEMVMSFPY